MIYDSFNRQSLFDQDLVLTPQDRMKSLVPAVISTSGCICDDQMASRPRVNSYLAAPAGAKRHDTRAAGHEEQDNWFALSILADIRAPISQNSDKLGATNG